MAVSGEVRKRRSENVLSLLIGIYLAFLVAPLGPLLLSLAAEPGDYWISLLFGAGLAVGAGATYAVSKRENLCDKVAEKNSDFVLLILTLPLVYFILFVVSLRSGVSTTTTEVYIPIAIGFFGVVPGVLISAFADYVHTRKLVEESRKYAEWKAKPDPGKRWYLTYGGALFIVAGAIGAYSGLLGYLVSSLMGLVGVLLIIDAGHSRKYVVTDAGLKVRDIAIPYLYPWKSFEGFSVEDDTLKIKRKKKWDHESFDLSGVDNPNEVREALSRFLEET